MTGNELREAYLRFFAEKKEHLRLSSYSLVPDNDPSLLLIGAGMAPLKPFFTGKITPPSRRIVTSQRCIRTGDIENVGRTARHQTFFEMLGNFSFGDYFKEKAIAWAWEFLTQEIGLPADKLWASIYPTDDEARNIWLKQPNFPSDHIVPLEDNFWEIGQGPCGPDSEIYIDLGEDRGCGSPTCKVGCDCERYLEIWNLVFTQYDKTETGEYVPLDNKNIDTGCGLERLASVVQGKRTNFDTDLLYPLIEYTSNIADIVYRHDEKKDISLKVIADHSRAITLMIMDGVLPSNEGRGYVLRRLIRRAVRHGRLLNINRNFLVGSVDIVFNIYKDASDFGMLSDRVDYIKKIVSVEEERFATTLSQGMLLLGSEIDNILSSDKREFPGELAFKLYDTYGFPVELTEEIITEQGLVLDINSFDVLLDEQRQRARNARTETQNESLIPDLSNISSEVKCVDEVNIQTSILAIWKNGSLVDILNDGDEGCILLKTTPFYPEGGGQTGDTGNLISDYSKATVLNTKKLPDGTIYNIVLVDEGYLKVNDAVKVKVDAYKKLSSARNHTATHLLHATLKKILGEHVNQAGSLVTPERLRFDFTSFEALSPQQLKDVESTVNIEILKGIDLVFANMSINEAKKQGATALFGEKYGEIVRVVEIPGVSTELCGGNHVRNTGQIGLFKIISETSVASGVRRIEAITGHVSLSYINDKLSILDDMANILKTKDDNILNSLNQLIETQKNMQEQLKNYANFDMHNKANQLLENLQLVESLEIITGTVEAETIDELKEIADISCDKLTNGVVAIATIFDKKVNLVIKLSNNAIEKGLHAGRMIKEIAPIIDGNGGGRPNIAQAGGTNFNNTRLALDSLLHIVKTQIK